MHHGELACMPGETGASPHPWAPPGSLCSSSLHHGSPGHPVSPSLLVSKSPCASVSLRATINHPQRPASPPEQFYRYRGGRASRDSAGTAAAAETPELQHRRFWQPRRFPGMSSSCAVPRGASRCNPTSPRAAEQEPETPAEQIPGRLGHFLPALPLLKLRVMRFLLFFFPLGQGNGLGRFPRSPQQPMGWRAGRGTGCAASSTAPARAAGCLPGKAGFWHRRGRCQPGTAAWGWGAIPGVRSFLGELGRPQHPSALQLEPQPKHGSPDSTPAPSSLGHNEPQVLWESSPGPKRAGSRNGCCRTAQRCPRKPSPPGIALEWDVTCFPKQRMGPSRGHFGPDTPRSNWDHREPPRTESSTPRAAAPSPAALEALKPAAVLNPSQLPGGRGGYFIFSSISAAPSLLAWGLQGGRYCSAQAALQTKGGTVDGGGVGVSPPAPPNSTICRMGLI